MPPSQALHFLHHHPDGSLAETGAVKGPDGAELAIELASAAVLDESDRGVAFPFEEAAIRPAFVEGWEPVLPVDSLKLRPPGVRHHPLPDALGVALNHRVGESPERIARRLGRMKVIFMPDELLRDHTGIE